MEWFGMGRLIVLLLFPVLLSGQNLRVKHDNKRVKFGGLGLAIPEPSTYNINAIALFSEMVPIPSSADKLIISNTFDFIPDTVLEKIDALYMSTATQSNSYLNWASPSNYTMYIDEGVPSFTPYRGFDGGGSSLLGTNYTMDGVGNFKQNSATMAVFVQTNSTLTQDEIGHNGAVDAYIRANQSGQLSTRLNDATTVGSTFIETAKGISTATRVDSNTRVLYRNNSLLFSNTGFTSTGVPNAELTLLGSNVLYSTKVISGGYVGAGLSTTEVKIINDAVNYYYNYYGYPLYEPVYDLVLFGDKESQFTVSKVVDCDRAILNQNPTQLIALGDYASITDSLENELRYYAGYSFTNNIWGAWGNHDIDFDSAGVAFESFYNVDNTYYTRIYGDIEYFFYNTLLSFDETEFISMGDAQSVDTTDVQNSTQGQWLISELANSTAKYKILIYHVPTWVSNFNLNTSPQMAWNWAAYGVDLIINSHVHFYERLLVPTGSGNVPVMNIGTSGANQLTVGTPSPYREAVYSDSTDADFGSGMFIGQEHNHTDTLRFILNAVDLSGNVTYGKDTLLITK